MGTLLLGTSTHLPDFTYQDVSIFPQHHIKGLNISTQCTLICISSFHLQRRLRGRIKSFCLLVCFLHYLTFWASFCHFCQKLSLSYFHTYSLRVFLFKNAHFCVEIHITLFCSKLICTRVIKREIHTITLFSWQSPTLDFIA